MPMLHFPQQCALQNILRVRANVNLCARKGMICLEYIEIPQSNIRTKLRLIHLHVYHNVVGLRIVRLAWIELNAHLYSAALLRYHIQ